jgi:hypothetical protein
MLATQLNKTILQWLIDSIHAKHPGESNFGDVFDLKAKGFLLPPGYVGGFINYAQLLQCDWLGCQN